MLLGPNQQEEASAGRRDTKGKKGSKSKGGVDFPAVLKHQNFILASLVFSAEFSKKIFCFSISPQSCGF